MKKATYFFSTIKDILIKPCLFQIEGIDPVYIPVKMDVVGCPLNFQMMKDQAPILRWVVGGNVHLPTFCLKFGSK